MKRFISVFILLFVVFGVANAEVKLVTAHPSERCVIYHCDWDDMNDLLQSEGLIPLEPCSLSQYIHILDTGYESPCSFADGCYVYIYDTLNNKKDWRTLGYYQGYSVDSYMNKNIGRVWREEEIPKYSNPKKTEYWQSKPKDILPVYCEISDYFDKEPRTKIIGAGNSSFIHDIITEAGGTNIFDDIDEPYVYSDEDLVIERAPEIIILLKSGCITPNDIKNRKGWENIPAIKNNRIYVIDDIPHSFLDIVQSTMTKQIQEAIKEYKK